MAQTVKIILQSDRPLNKLISVLVNSLSDCSNAGADFLGEVFNNGEEESPLEPLLLRLIDETQPKAFSPPLMKNILTKVSNVIRWLHKYLNYKQVGGLWKGLQVCADFVLKDLESNMLLALEVKYDYEGFLFAFMLGAVVHLILLQELALVVPQDKRTKEMMSPLEQNIKLFADRYQKYVKDEFQRLWNTRRSGIGEVKMNLEKAMDNKIEFFWSDSFREKGGSIILNPASLESVLMPEAEKFHKKYIFARRKEFDTRHWGPTSFFIEMSKISMNPLPKAQPEKAKQSPPKHSVSGSSTSTASEGPDVPDDGGAVERVTEMLRVMRRGAPKTPMNDTLSEWIEKQESKLYPNQ